MIPSLTCLYRNHLCYHYISNHLCYHYMSNHLYYHYRANLYKLLSTCITITSVITCITTTSVITCITTRSVITCITTTSVITCITTTSVTTCITTRSVITCITTTGVVTCITSSLNPNANHHQHQVPVAVHHYYTKYLCTCFCTALPPRLTCIGVDTCLLTPDDDLVELPGDGVCQFLTPVLGRAEDQHRAPVLGDRLQAEVDHMVFIVLKAGNHK